MPAGGCDGDDPLVAARRELLEETRFTANEWQQIGQMNALSGVCDAPECVYLATGLRRADRGPDDETPAHDHPRARATDVERPAECATLTPVDTAAEQATEGIDAVRFVPWQNAMSLVRDGTISDGETVAALLYAALATGRICPQACPADAL